MTGRDRGCRAQRRDRIVPVQVTCLQSTHDQQAVAPPLISSRARGEAKPDSDFDVLVVVERTDEPEYRLDQAAYRAVGLHLFPLDILVMTRADFERRARAPSSLPATVLREGRMLYAA